MDDLTGLTSLIIDMFKDHTTYSVGWTALGLVGIILAKKVIKFVLGIALFLYIAFKMFISSNIIDLNMFLK